MQPKSYLFCLILAFLVSAPLMAQEERVEEIAFGNMDQWIDRQIKESGIIGGDTKHVYAIGPTQTITNNEAYRNLGGSPWASSNVMARVAGVTKTNTSVFPEKRGNGYCARMDTRMESVKVLGLVNITVLAAGSVFLGEMHEPITSTKDPMRKLDTGIPFTKKPKAIRFDYTWRDATSPKSTSISRSVGKTRRVTSMPSVWARWLSALTKPRQIGRTTPLIPSFMVTSRIILSMILT